MKSLLLILFLYPFGLYAQKQGQKRVDSLLTELPRAKHDTNQVNLLRGLSYAYDGINTDRAMMYATKALELAKELGFENVIAKAYNELGWAYDCQGLFEDALKNYLAALTIVEKMGAELEIAGYKQNIGNAYINTGNYEGALEYLTDALKTLKKIGGERDIAACSANIGRANHRIGFVYYSRQDTRKANEYFKEALKYINPAITSFKNLNDKTSLTKCYISLGAVYYGLGKYPEAIQTYDQAFQLAGELGNKSLTARTHLDAAYTLFKQNKLAETEENCKKALTIAKELGNSDLVLEANNFLERLKSANNK